jgi:hypothetical protein
MAVSFPRKWLLVLAGIAASLSVILAAIWIASLHGPGRGGNATVPGAPAGTPPSVVFAAGVTSGNEGLNAFIRNFIALCQRCDYEQYRLCWTAYGTPMSSDRFQLIWKFTRKVVINQIVPVPPEVKVMHPAYIIRGVAELDPKARIASKDVEVMVQWEDNHWAVAPAPRLESEPAAAPATDIAPASQPDGRTAQHG